MFHTLITADLPSEEVEGAAPTDDAYAPTHDRVTLSARHLIRMIVTAMASAGLRDVSHLVIDGEVVYADEKDDDSADLDLIGDITRDEGYLRRKFDELVLGLVHWEDDIQHVVHVRVRMAVPAGEHELEMRIASRPDDFNARRLDDAERLAMRLLEAAASMERMSSYKQRVGVLCERLVGSLQRQLGRRDMQRSRTMLRVVRPTQADLLSMNHLGFVDRVERVSYDLTPVLGDDAWDDPALHVYDDPYLVFRHWVFLHAVMVEGLLRNEWVQIVEPDGKELFLGHKARWFESWPWGTKFEVDLVDGGGVTVSWLDGA